MVDRLRDRVRCHRLRRGVRRTGQISPATVAKNLPEAVRNTDLRRTLESLPDSDEVFAEAIARANVVTGFAFDGNARAIRAAYVGRRE